MKICFVLLDFEKYCMIFSAHFKIPGGNAGSLVGVAISASLLPPAVNCGLFWSLALVLLGSSDSNYLIGYYDDQDNSTWNFPEYQVSIPIHLYSYM